MELLHHRDPDGVLDDWSHKFEAEVTKLKSLGIGATLGLFRDIVTPSLPSEMGTQIKEVIDDHDQARGIPFDGRFYIKLDVTSPSRRKRPSGT
jgi:hypothetical protein